MKNDNVFDFIKPEQIDPLQELLRDGARKMLASAIEAEVVAFIAKHGHLKLEDGKAAVVRNGYLPERPIQSGLGDIEVKVPKVRDRSGSGIKFNSRLIPPYLKRTKSIEEFLPWLYLRGIYPHGALAVSPSPAGKTSCLISRSVGSKYRQSWLSVMVRWDSGSLSQAVA